LRNVLVVAAEDFELSGIKRRAASVSKPDWPIRFARIAELNGSRLLLAAHGPGRKLAGAAAAVVKSREQVDAVVSTGICGGLDPDLAVGDVLVASAVNESPAEMPKTSKPYRTGRVISMDRVVGTVDEKCRLRASGGSAVEMEAAALAGLAAEWRKPFYCVRSVSDSAKEGFELDLNLSRDPEGRFSRPRIIASALRRPFRLVPELLRLRRNSAKAAEALGEFFAHCHF